MTETNIIYMEPGPKKPVINFWNANDPEQVKHATGLYTIKVITDYIHGTLYFKLYRCAHVATPNMPPPTEYDGVPEGDRIYGSKEDLITMCRMSFPIIIRMGGVPYER